MPKKWDVDAAITRAIIDGVPTKRILEGIRAGTLPLLNRAQALPDRTFYQSLARCRRRLGTLGPPRPASFLEDLRAREAARQEGEASAVNGAAESPSKAPEQNGRSDRLPTAVPAISPPRSRGLRSVVRELERLADSPDLEAMPGSQVGSGERELVG
jgi:hypothetical protein